MTRTPRPPRPPAVDWRTIATAVETLREMCRAAVAGLVADGFTEDQARTIVTATLAKSAQQ